MSMSDISCFLKILKQEIHIDAKVIMQIPIHQYKRRKDNPHAPSSVSN